MVMVVVISMDQDRWSNYEVDEAAKKNMEEDTKQTLDSMFCSQAVQENFQKVAQSQAVETKSTSLDG